MAKKQVRRQQQPLWLKITKIILIAVACAILMVAIVVRVIHHAENHF